MGNDLLDLSIVVLKGGDVEIAYLLIDLIKDKSLLAICPTIKNLGFKPAVAARAVAAAQGELGEGASEGELIRVALKKAAG